MQTGRAPISAGGFGSGTHASSAAAAASRTVRQTGTDLGAGIAAAGPAMTTNGMQVQHEAVQSAATITSDYKTTTSDRNERLI